MIRERESHGLPGLPVLLTLLLAVAVLVWRLVLALQAHDAGVTALAAIGVAVCGLLLAGLFMVNPNEGKVLQLFGRYVGTARTQGLRWANPFLTKRSVSLRIRNFESSHLKVNDLEGNPIEIAAVVVWKVVETAEAAFEVDDYGISHLAYAPEIAAAMLQRQQAGAIIAARQRIVEGAVGMVEMALDMLSQKAILTLDEERKAAMVSNLLVVLCGDRNTQPVINTGTIYQ